MKQINQAALIAHLLESHRIGLPNSHAHQKQLERDHESSSSDENEEIKQFYTSFKWFSYSHSVQNMHKNYTFIIYQNMQINKIKL